MDEYYVCSHGFCTNFAVVCSGRKRHKGTVEYCHKTVRTAYQNSALQDWLERYPPPASKTAHFKIRYMTQASVNPVNFVIFATRPEVVPEPYITYLKNRIREDLGYDQIPVQLELKGSRQKWEDRQ